MTVKFLNGWVETEAVDGAITTDDVVDETFVWDENCPYCGNPHFRKEKPLRSVNIHVECRNCDNEVATYKRICRIYIQK